MREFRLPKWLAYLSPRQPASRFLFRIGVVSGGLVAFASGAVEVVEFSMKTIATMKKSEISLNHNWCLSSKIISSDFPRYNGLSQLFDFNFLVEEGGSVVGTGRKVRVNGKTPFPAEVSKITLNESSVIRDQELTINFTEQSTYHKNRKGIEIHGSMNLTHDPERNIFLGHMSAQPSNVKSEIVLFNMDCSNIFSHPGAR